MIRLGIIGCGRISDLHAHAYLDHPEATIVAVADPDAANLATRGAAWGVPESGRYQDYRDLLARSDVDAVEILVPHHLHAPITLDAMDAGKHVSLQKPMALSMDEAALMVRAGHERGVTFKVFENFVFYPPVVRAKELVENGEIGDLLSIRIKSNPGWSPTAWDVPAAASAWRIDESKCGGGPLVFDDGHHKFAIAWYFLGLADRVHAFIGSSMDGVLDCPSIVSWHHPDGQVGSLEVAYSPDLRLHTAQYAQDDRVEITGTRGVIWVTRGHGRMLDVPPVILYRDGETRGFSDMPTGWESSFLNSGRHFVDALRDGTSPSLTGEEGAEVLAFALAAQESAKTGTAAAPRVAGRDGDAAAAGRGRGLPREAGLG
ncbi:gfo/Idh/MocA family oxidoreductase [Actinomadura logoneensis]|uniref:Gfo/Idh/MocA family oxidoreductase n=1 Tax=Actinomadura logoneensis TaxID=2293572 RepID=A0A372J8T1_9ACTN|nr:Gfo/Idh/MocA family oxidoreductase [Actinomadura logoneensis]RFU36390.1 gfo/Idh/MocA family oxidoreductase [Actinomadura logoneensis]